MLSVEESSQLYSLLSAEHRPFGEIVADFFSKFPSSNLRFRMCSALATLLKDAPMLRSSQRMVAICVLHQSYASQQPSANPFISALLDVACDERFEMYERGVVLHLLGACCPGSSKEVLEQTPAEYVNGFHPEAHHFPSRQKLEEQFGNKAVSEPYKCLFKDSSVKNIIPDPDIPHQCNASSPEFDAQPGSDPKIGSGDRDEAIVQVLQNLSLRGIEPQWIRPHPPRLPVQDGELVWLDPQGNHELLWDYGMCADMNRELVKNLAAKALKETLPPAQQEQLLLGLANDSKLVHHCGLAYYRLPELVEKNPLVAVQVLITLMNSPEILNYYFALVHMDLSLHSMVVVNRLTATVGLPIGFLHLFIRNCLSSCRKTKDKFKQTRLVRLTCVFLRSLIKKEIINGDVVSGPLVTFSGVENVGNILHALTSTNHNGFPVIDEPPFSDSPALCGVVLRSHLLVLLKAKYFTKERVLSGREILGRFSPHDFAKPGTGKGIRMEDVRVSEEEKEMYVDLHPITNASPYTVVETMSLAKAAVLFRQLGLRHMCVVPKSKERPPIVGILTRHDFMPEHVLGLYPHMKPATNLKARLRAFLS